MDTNLYEQRTRVQNQQTNTFLKGMDTDTSDMLLGTDQYRYAENVRIVTDTDNNTGELRLIEGNTQIDLGIQGQLLSLDAIRDMIVFVVKSNDNLSWKVYKYKPNIDDLQQALTEVLNIQVIDDEDKIWKTENDVKPITTILRWESDNNIKLYIADNTGNHGILVVDLTNTYESSHFSEVFEYQQTVLNSPIVSVRKGGSLKPAIVQYAYRIYKENGSSTTLSALSKPLSLYKNENSGFAYDTNSNKSVSITIDYNGSILNRIQLYRITYEQIGQEPTIHLIRDEKLSNGQYVDSGSNISSISVSEFISMYNLYIRPKIIESKSDYLFAANLNYQQDSVDDEFKNFDAVAKNKGYYENGGIIGNKAFEDEEHPGEYNQSGEYLSDWWEADENGYNGVGKNIAWKYIYNTEDITFKYSDNTKIKYNGNYKTYKRGEIYRFGIRLFNKKGIPSSVKWIADIQIPNDKIISISDDPLLDYFQYSTKEIGIQFIPLNTNAWNNVYAYEIVQCPRTISDKFTITQGIVGHVHEIYTFPSAQGNHTLNNGIATNHLTPVGFLSMEDVCAVQADLELNGYSTFGPGDYSCRYAIPNRQILQFASPEYVYQSDDIENIISQLDEDIYIKCIASYIPYSKICTDIYDRYSSDHPSMNSEDSVITRCRDSESYNLHNTVRFIMSGYTDTFPYALGINMDDNNPDINHVSDEFYYFGPEVAIYNTGRDLHKSTSQDALILTGIHSINGVYGLSDERLHRHDLNIETQNNNTGLAWTQHFFNYLFPELQQDTLPFDEEIQITNVSYADSPDYSDFSNSNNTINIKNNSTGIGGKTFINWTAPFISTESDPSRIESLLDYTSNLHAQLPQVNNPTSDSDGRHPEMQGSFYPIGTGGKCMLLQLSTPITRYKSTEPIFNHMPEICVANIKKYAIPYGGYTESSINNSKYISVGAYKVLNRDNNDFEGNNSIELYEGDAFIKMFTYYNSHDWFDPLHRRFFKNATVYSLPIEMYIDIQGQFSNSLYGVTTNKTLVQDKASAFNGYTQENDAYLYNTAYNDVTDVSTWYPDTRTLGQVNNYDTRVHYSQKKSNNETIDSWTQFKTADFLDVDTRYGEITALQLFKNKLMFWQDRATGILSVNERVMLQDINSNQIALGTGQVLERFDYFSTLYGQIKEQYNQESSDSSLYWWDGNNKEILAYTDAQNIIQLSTIKHIKNYINKRQQSISPNIIYDQKYKEVICNVVEDECIVYNELTQSFTSIYKYTPCFYCNYLGQNYITPLYTNPDYKITVTGVVSVLVGDKYQNNDITFTVLDVDITGGAGTILLSGSNSPQESGTFTKVTGNGDSTISYSEVENVFNVKLYKENTSNNNQATLFDQKINPYINYIINLIPQYNKVFDIQTFGGRFYGGGSDENRSIPYSGTEELFIGDKHARNNNVLQNLNFIYKTPLKQESRANGKDFVTNTEYDFRLTIPRAGKEIIENEQSIWKVSEYGDRMKGKTMQCEIKSDSNNLDFSLQYITTKFRISWT